MRRFAIIAVLLSATLGLAVPSQAAPYCGLSWGSTAETVERYTGATLSDIRVGRHGCFDRLVFDLDGRRAAGYRVRYVEAVKAEGSGDGIPLRGAAQLQVSVLAPAYGNSSRPTYTFQQPNELVKVSGFRTLRQVAWAGSFEGQTTIGLGVRTRLPFRVFVLDGPSGGQRVVLDVAHRW
ncbi:MAG: hypothetical protein M3415_05015 [Actinomycetota bacterium]|jgi:hypothetical protein|nr:hypothetical protein [Actinomycetota bacterium]